MIKAFTVVASTLLAAAGAQAQTTPVQFGLKAGMSLAVLDGTINKGAEIKTGLHVGGFLRWRATPRFALQPELVYTQQGCNNRIPLYGFNSNLVLESKTKLSYLNVPVLAKVYLGKVFYLQAGPQLGLLLAGREVGQTGYISSSSGNRYTTADVDVKDDYKGDVSVCAGLGIDLPMGLMVAARANYGFTDINNDEQDRQARERLGFGGLHNRVIDVSVGYAFGGK